MVESYSAVFNISSSPSEDMKRKLLYLATSDNDSVLSGFTPIAGFGNSASDAKEAQYAFDYVQMAYASIQNLSDLREKLQADQLADIEYREEIRQQLQEAEEALRLTREKALSINMGDGTFQLAYLDGDTLRFESGSLVPKELRPDYVPPETPTYDQFKFIRDREAQLSAAEAKATARIDRRAEIIDGIDNGAIQDNQLDDLKDELADLELPPEITKSPSTPPTTERTFATSILPAGDFLAAANPQTPPSEEPDPETDFPHPLVAPPPSQSF